MRILFINPVGQIGGAERVLLDCIASIRLAEAGHEIHLVLMDDGPLVDEAQRLGAKVLVLSAPTSIRSVGDSAMNSVRRPTAKARMILAMLRAAPAGWRYARRLRRQIQAIAPDVIHSNGLKSHLLIGQPVSKRPVVWHIHDFVGARPVIAKLLRRVGRSVAPIAVSPAVAEDVRRWLPHSMPRVVLNGIDLDRFSPGPGDGARLDALASLPTADPGTVRVGLVATYGRWKGQDLFLQAAAELLRDRIEVPVRFYIVGGPIYSTAGSQFLREELISLSQKLGLGAQVGFVSFQEDTTAVYRALDIVVHASTQPEPFGLTIAQAMACGRAVIVSSSSSASEWIEDGVNAVSVAMGQSAEMARLIRKLAIDPSLRARLSANARRSALAKLDRRRFGPELLSLYRRLENVK